MPSIQRFPRYPHGHLRRARRSATPWANTAGPRTSRARPLSRPSPPSTAAAATAPLSPSPSSTPIRPSAASRSNSSAWPIIGRSGKAHGACASSAPTAAKSSARKSSPNRFSRSTTGGGGSRSSTICRAWASRGIIWRRRRCRRRKKGTRPGVLSPLRTLARRRPALRSPRRARRLRPLSLRAALRAPGRRGHGGFVGNGPRQLPEGRRTLQALVPALRHRAGTGPDDHQVHLDLSGEPHRDGCRRLSVLARHRDQVPRHLERGAAAAEAPRADRPRFRVPSLARSPAGPSRVPPTARSTSTAAGWSSKGKRSSGRARRRREGQSAPGTVRWRSASPRAASTASTSRTASCGFPSCGARPIATSGDSILGTRRLKTGTRTFGAPLLEVRRHRRPRIPAPRHGRRPRVGQGDDAGPGRPSRRPARGVRPSALRCESRSAVRDPALPEALLHPAPRLQALLGRRGARRAAPGSRRPESQGDAEGRPVRGSESGDTYPRDTSPIKRGTCPGGTCPSDLRAVRDQDACASKRTGPGERSG